jgi:hypothetical protein
MPKPLDPKAVEAIETIMAIFNLDFLQEGLIYPLEGVDPLIAHYLHKCIWELNNLAHSLPTTDIRELMKEYHMHDVLEYPKLKAFDGRIEVV